ncbi:MAG: hypothetical protein ACSLE2_05860 [Lysobacterales bacterium]
MVTLRVPGMADTAATVAVVAPEGSAAAAVLVDQVVKVGSEDSLLDCTVQVVLAGRGASVVAVVAVVVPTQAVVLPEPQLLAASAGAPPRSAFSIPTEAEAPVSALRCSFALEWWS